MPYAALPVPLLAEVCADTNQGLPSYPGEQTGTDGIATALHFFPGFVKLHWGG